MIEDIWRKFHQQLLLFIRSKVNDQSIAEDILQETFIKISGRINSLKEPEKLNSWLYQICRNTIIDYYRQQSFAFDENIELDNLPSLENESNSSKQQEQLGLCIEILIHDLNSTYKDILVAHEINNIKQDSIAKQYNLSLAAVKSRIKRGREKLKEKLLRCCEFEFSEIGITNTCKNNCGCS